MLVCFFMEVVYINEYDGEIKGKWLSDWREDGVETSILVF